MGNSATEPGARRCRHGLSLALLAAAPLCALATELPARKPGLWESSLHLQASRRPPPRTRLCLDAATDALLFRYGTGLSKEHCPQLEITGSGGEFTIRSTCEVGTHRVSTQMVMTFSGDTAYHLVIQSHYEPPLDGRSDTRSEQDARWVGACEPGQRPGDMVIDPPGIRLNVRDALAKSPRP